MLTIRRARQEDCESIASLHIAAVKAISTEFYTNVELAAWAVPKDIKSYQESVCTKECFVVEYEEVIVGFGVLNPATIEIEAVYVSPAAGRRGIGLQLLTMLEQRAVSLGLTMLRLNASLNAVPFYERAGFVAQERSKYRLMSGVEIACVPMIKAIGGNNQP